MGGWRLWRRGSEGNIVNCVVVGCGAGLKNSRDDDCTYQGIVLTAIAAAYTYLSLLPPRAAGLLSPHLPESLRCMPLPLCPSLTYPMSPHSASIAGPL